MSGGRQRRLGGTFLVDDEQERVREGIGCKRGDERRINGGGGEMTVQVRVKQGV